MLVLLLLLSCIHPSGTNHLGLRSWPAAQQSSFPGSAVPGSFFFNPVQQNLYAVDYYTVTATQVGRW